MSKNRWKEIQIVIYSYSGILLSNRKEWTTVQQRGWISQIQVLVKEARRKKSRYSSVARRYDDRNQTSGSSGRRWEKEEVWDSSIEKVLHVNVFIYVFFFVVQNKDCVVHNIKITALISFMCTNHWH